MQNPWVIAIGSLVVGLATGVVAAFWQYGESTEITIATPMDPGATSGRPYQPGTATLPEGPQPRVHVDEQDFAFGNMEAGGHRTHEFVVHNQGDAPLTLKQLETTCKCTLSEVTGDEIPPGGSTSVKLEWRAESGPGPFRQSATIGTNDPQRPTFTLSVSGEVTESVLTTPPEVVFSQLRVTETSSARVKIYALHADNLEIAGHTFDGASGPKQFDVSYQAIPREDLEEKRAKSGVLVTITTKPGLPLGPVRQKITLSTNLKNPATVDIPVSGAVSSDVSILGPDWNPTTATLKFGVVESGRGIERTLKLVTHGNHSQTIEFKVVSRVPEFLQVSLGPRKEMVGGTVSQTPITIKVPRGSPPANHSGSAVGKLGIVKLETNHPDVKEVRLNVQFVVEN